MADIERIYNEYMPQVYRYLFSLCQDSNLAEELIPETFFQTLKSIRRFRGDPIKKAPEEIEEKSAGLLHLP